MVVHGGQGRGSRHDAHHACLTQSGQGAWMGHVAWAWGMDAARIRHKCLRQGWPGARPASRRWPPPTLIRSWADLKRLDRCWFIFARGATPAGTIRMVLRVTLLTRDSRHRPVLCRPRLPLSPPPS